MPNIVSEEIASRNRANATSCMQWDLRPNMSESCSSVFYPPALHVDGGSQHAADFVRCTFPMNFKVQWSFEVNGQMIGLTIDRIPQLFHLTIPAKIDFRNFLSCWSSEHSGLARPFWYERFNWRFFCGNMEWIQGNMTFEEFLQPFLKNHASASTVAFNMSCYPRDARVLAIAKNIHFGRIREMPFDFDASAWTVQRLLQETAALPTELQKDMVTLLLTWVPGIQPNEITFVNDLVDTTFMLRHSPDVSFCIRWLSDQNVGPDSRIWLKVVMHWGFESFSQADWDNLMRISNMKEMVMNFPTIYHWLPPYHQENHDLIVSMLQSHGYMWTALPRHLRMNMGYQILALSQRPILTWIGNDIFSHHPAVWNHMAVKAARDSMLHMNSPPNLTATDMDIDSAVHPAALRASAAPPRVA